MKLFHVFFLIAVICLESAAVLASQIAMTAELKVTEKRNFIEADLTIANRGDADSLVVYPWLKLGQEEVKLKEVPYIAFGGSSRWTHRFETRGLDFHHRGTYPLFLMIYYHDSNMYSFSMPQVFLLNYRSKPLEPLLSGSLDVSKVNHSGRARATVRNPLEHEITGTLELFLSDDLHCSKGKTEFTLSEGKSTREDFALENSGALKGSTYTGYAVVQAVHNGLHRCLVISEMIKVAGYGEGGKTPGKVAGGIIFLVILFFAAIGMELKKAKGKNAPGRSK